MPKKRAPTKPSCFVSYSMREPHLRFFIECLKLVFDVHYRVELTPSALQSGTSQREQIISLIKRCSFGVVLLDGLRPNVVWEFGVMQGFDRPVMLFKEDEAKVDISSFFRDPATLGVGQVPLDVDSHFSNIKDLTYVSWKRFELQNTVRTIWQEYGKKNKEIRDHIVIPEPKLCT